MRNQHTSEASMTAKSYALPLLSVLIGLAYLTVGLIGDQPDLVVAGPLIMFAIGAGLLLLRRRSETLKGLMDRRDERINSLDLRATAATGLVLVVAILVAFMVEVARGNDGAPYVWLGSLGGLTYLGALVVLRVRG